MSAEQPSGRITAEQVIAAYRETGMKPVQGCYINFEDGHPCGCAIGTMIGRLFPSLLVDTGEWEDSEHIDAIQAVHGLTWEYRYGFECGFDGDADYMIDLDCADARQGYRDGQAAWSAVSALPELARAERSER